MEDDQSLTGDSESSIQSRIAAALSPAPEVAPREDDGDLQPLGESDYSDGGDEAPAAESDTEEAQPEGDEPAGGLVEVEDDAGQTHKVPAALKDSFLRRADYTRKTQEAATLAKQAQDRLYYAEAREQITSAVVNDLAELRAMQLRLREFDGIDLGALYSSDTGTALRIRDQRDELRRQINEREAAIRGKASEIEAKTTQHLSTQWQMAVDAAKQRIGTFTPGEDAAMLKQVRELGFSEDEVRAKLADPRILHAVYKAAKWDALQAKKGQAVETAKSAPPVVKPGANNAQQVQSVQKYKQARDVLKRDGSVQSAARLLLLRSK